MLRNAFEWAESMGITIIDADGWRHDHKSMRELIDQDEFLYRMGMSTISRLNNLV